jgi:hypothetical protein
VEVRGRLVSLIQEVKEIKEELCPFSAFFAGDGQSPLV